MRRIKNETFAASPKSGEEIIAAFEKENIMSSFGYSNHENPKTLYKGTIMDGDNYVCTFLVSETIIDMIATNIDLERRRYMMDATFKIVPVGIFKQLLIIYVEYLDCVSANLFVLNCTLHKEFHLDSVLTLKIDILLSYIVLDFR